MLRTLAPISILVSTLAALAAPCAAQDAHAIPAPYGSSAEGAPVYAPAPTIVQPIGRPATYSAFAPYDRQGRTLVGTRHEMQNDRGLWGAGLGLFLAGWVVDIVGTAIFNAASHDRDGAVEEDSLAWSIVPWIGPFIQLGLEAPHPALPILTGLMQITGTVMFVIGLTSQHDTEVPIYGWPGIASVGFDVAPTDGGAIATVTLRTM